MMTIIVAVLVLDLVTKYVFDATLSFNETKTIIPYLFNFKLVHNIGAAWGVLAGKQVFLIALSIVFLVIFIVYYSKEKNKTWLLNVTFGLLIGGCIGNLYDRIFVGYVRDFIQFDFWQSFPVFNFADVALSFGVVLFVIYLVLYFVRLKKTEKKTGIMIEKFDDKNENSAFENEKKNKENLQEIENLKMQKEEEKQMAKKINAQKNAKNAANLQKNEKNLKENTKKNQNSSNISKSKNNKKNDEGGQ